MTGLAFFLIVTFLCLYFVAQVKAERKREDEVTQFEPTLEKKVA